MTQSAALGQIGNVPGASYRLDANTVAKALATFSSGSTAPPVVYPFMLWWDTVANTLRMRNPANSGWVDIGSWTGSQFRPCRDGAALGTAATRDHGTAANQLLALDASARLPAVDASQLLNLPAGNSTGDVKLTLETTQPAGWLFCDGKTLGTVASGASYAGTTYQALFTFLWDRITASWCPLTDSAGNAVGRGASAAADWSANRRLALPDARGSVLLVRDNLGGSTAGRVTAASVGGANATAIAARGGAETHALTVSQMPSHDHGAATGSAGSHSHSYTQPAGAGDYYTGGAGANVYTTQSGNTGAAGSHSHGIAAQGGGGAHSTMPPWFSLGLLIKV